ncbi:MAG TPA: hypothetical protein VGJ32_12575, partial [Solirubrobacteraceae bacterium]
ALRKALPGPAEKALGLGRAVPQAGPAPAAAAQAGLLGAGAAGGLAGAAPIGYRLRRAVAGLAPPAAAAPQLEVRVFIGDTELRGIVRTEVRQADERTAQVLLAGAR